MNNSFKTVSLGTSFASCRSYVDLGNFEKETKTPPLTPSDYEEISEKDDDSFVSVSRSVFLEKEAFVECETAESIAVEMCQEAFSRRKYSVLSRLGKGAFSDVVKVGFRDEKMLAALKTTDTSSHPALSRQIEKEFGILKTLSHPCIIKAFGIQSEYGCTYTLLELGSESTLDDFLGMISKDGLSFISAQVASALIYLEERRVLHRDIKPSNILIDRKGNIKLVDFGFARRLEEGSSATTLCGTGYYSSPEVAAGWKEEGALIKYSMPSQWWSFGVFLSVLCYNDYPFAGIEEILFKNPVFERPLNFRDQYFQDLLLALLIKDAHQRAGAEEVKSHAFFQGLDWSQLHLPRKEEIKWLLIDSLLPKS